MPTLAFVRYFDVYLYKSLHFCIWISATNCEDGHIDINQKQLSCPSHHLNRKRRRRLVFLLTPHLELSHPLQCSRARFLNHSRCTVSWPYINRDNSIKIQTYAKLSRPISVNYLEHPFIQCQCERRDILRYPWIAFTSSISLPSIVISGSPNALMAALQPWNTHNKDISELRQS